MSVSLSVARLLAAASLWLAVPSAFAAFSFTVERTDAGARDALWIRTTNDGVGGSGNDVHSFQLTLEILPAPGQPAARAYFAVNDTNANSVPDTVDLTNAGDLAGFGFFRVGSAANTRFVPGTNGTQPPFTFVEPNPWSGGVSSFDVIATNSGQTAPASGTSALIAQLLVDDGAGFSGIATIGGEIGPAFRNLPIAIAPLPEPTSLLTAMTCLLIPRRRRRA